MRFEADLSGVSPSTMLDILHLQKAFHIAPTTTKDAVVGRKIGIDALKTMAKSAGIKHLQDIQPGAIIQDEGVVSTSHSPSVWSGEVNMRINLPKGSKAIHVSGVSHHAHEDETLLPPGTKFKVSGVEHHGGDSFTIQCEAIT